MITDSIKNPSPPCIISTIQVMVVQYCTFQVENCMPTLQISYEHRYITYHRTSIPSISNTFQNIAKQHITSNHGEEYAKSRSCITWKENIKTSCAPPSWLILLRREAISTFSVPALLSKELFFMTLLIGFVMWLCKAPFQNFTSISPAEMPAGPPPSTWLRPEERQVSI